MNVFGDPALTLNYRQLKPERFIEEIYRGARERHTQKKFAPVAMTASLQTISRWKTPRRRPRSKAAATGTAWQYWPSTFQLNRTNVKRKPAARGRAR